MRQLKTLSTLVLLAATLSLAAAAPAQAIGQSCWQCRFVRFSGYFCEEVIDTGWTDCDDANPWHCYELGFRCGFQP